MANVKHKIEIDNERNSNNRIEHMVYDDLEKGTVVHAQGKTLDETYLLIIDELFDIIRELTEELNEKNSI